MNIIFLLEEFQSPFNQMVLKMLLSNMVILSQPKSQLTININLKVMGLYVSVILIAPLKHFWNQVIAQNQLVLNMRQNLRLTLEKSTITFLSRICLITGLTKISKGTLKHLVRSHHLFVAKMKKANSHLSATDRVTNPIGSMDLDAQKKQSKKWITKILMEKFFMLVKHLRKTNVWKI